MTNKQCLKLVKEVLGEAQKNMLKNAVKAIESGGIAISDVPVEVGYGKAKTILVALLENEAELWSSGANYFEKYSTGGFKREVNNLKKFI